jgi:Uma2 family endonuclease
VVVAALPTPYLTPEQYLELDRHSERPSEYSDGHAYPIENTTARHSLMLFNLAGTLKARLAGTSCKVMGATLRVRIPRTKMKYVYPDVIVSCGKLEFDDEHRDTLLNPTVLFEILSPSTGDYDRGTKGSWYRSIPSLKTYVVIAQDQVSVTRYTRQAEQDWLLKDLISIHDVLDLDAINSRIALAEIYHEIELDEPAQD